MPKRGPFIHLACQQWSLILWSLRIPVGADCVEDLSVQYHTHLPVLPSPEDLCLSRSCSFSTLSSLSPPFLSSLSSQGWRFTPCLLQASASADSGCSSQFNPEDTSWHKEHRVCAQQFCIFQSIWWRFDQYLRQRNEKKQSTNMEQIILPSNSKTLVNKSCQLTNGYNAGTAMCCEHRNIRWLPEPHVNLTGFHRLKQCLRWWRFHSNRLSVVRESFLGWLWFAAQSGVSEKSLPLCSWNPRCAIMSITLPFFLLFHLPLSSPGIRYLHSECSSLRYLLHLDCFLYRMLSFLNHPLIHQFYFSKVSPLVLN